MEPIVVVLVLVVHAVALDDERLEDAFFGGIVGECAGSLFDTADHIVTLEVGGFGAAVAWIDIGNTVAGPEARFSKLSFTAKFLALRF